MALTSEERQKIRTGIARYWSRFWIETELSKVEIFQTVVATDQWIDDNQASYNSALPAIAQASLSLPQKTFIFCVVAAARVSLDFLRRLVGGID